MTATRQGAEPTPELDQRFSSPGASPTPWAVARDELEAAEMYWLTTVRADGRPHVTPLAAIMLDGAFYFATGITEQKARNLEHSKNVVVTTGCNAFDRGTDIVLEGVAEPVQDNGILQALADSYRVKYHGVFDFEVRDGGFRERSGGDTIAFRVNARKGFAFGRGKEFSQTRWRF
jgi:nitroimidazol reductase NimA-like FMN-containing flavoprotein (pyridoxamine 5'-phosphate oxidase superfamily)